MHNYQMVAPMRLLVSPGQRMIGGETVMAELDPADLLPPLTAYYIMRIGRLPLVPYYPPGDLALADAVRHALAALAEAGLVLVSTVNVPESG